MNIYKLATLLLLTVLSIWNAPAQGALYCPDVTSPGFISGYVTIPFDAALTAQGTPLPIGSHIIAVYEDGDGVIQCAGERTWEGYTTVLVVRGASGNVPGYQAGQVYAFWVELPDGCMLTDVEASFEVNSAFPNGDTFGPAGQSRIHSLSAASAYQITEIENIPDTCHAGVGLIEVAASGAVAPYTYTWSEGSSSLLTDATEGNYFVTVTDAQACTTIDTFFVSNEPCPILQCDASCNGRPDGDESCLPFTVNFADATQSEAGIQSYSWDFGDGNGSTEASPSHTYQVPGSYVASLVVFDGYQYDTTTLDITVFPLPTADWSYEPVVCTPEQVSFVAQSTDDIVSWAWAFDDGTTSAAASPVLTFSSPGMTVSGILTVESAAGCTSEIPLEVMIPEAYGLSLLTEITAAPTCAEANGSITVTVEGGAMPFAYTWSHDADLDGPAVSDLPPGDYAVTIIDANGCTDEATFSLADDTEVPVPELGPDTAFCANEIVPLSVGASFSSIQWLLDGVPVAGATQSTFLPTQSGTYGVEVVNESGCIGEDQQEVTIFSLPTADWNYEPAVCTPQQVNFFTAGTPGITDWSWTFEDGTTSQDPEPTLTFSSTGITIAGMLSLVSSDGCTNELPVEVEVPEAYDLVLAAENIVWPSCTAANGSISVAVSGGGGPYTYSWSQNEILDQPIAEGLPPGTYDVSLTDGNGCMAEISFMLTDTTQVPVPDVGGDLAFCADEPEPLAVSDTFASIQWFLDGTVIMGSDESTYQPTASGTYRVEVTNADGCVGTDETIVTIFELPSAALGEDILLCLPTTITLDVSCSGCSYMWSTGSDMPAIEAAADNIYAVTVIDGNGCSASDELNVEALPQPAVDLGDDFEICPGESAMLVAGAEPDGIYVWSTGAMTSMITVAAGGQYTVTVTNEEGCSASDTLNLTVVDGVSASIMFSDSLLCLGDTLELIGTGAEDLLWIDTSFVITTPNVPDVSFVPLSTAQYGLIAWNRCFSDTAYIAVQVVQQQAFAGPDTCVASQRPALITASGATTYQWLDETRKDVIGTEPQLQVRPDSTTRFFVEMTDTAGCTYLDSVLVEVLFLEELDLDAINTITPNEDGYNDVLEFPRLTKFDHYSLTIFNRHGTIIYRSLNYQNDWDGTRQGTPLPEGVYFYILRIGQQEIKSSLTLIRD